MQGNEKDPRRVQLDLFERGPERAALEREISITAPKIDLDGIRRVLNADNRVTPAGMGIGGAPTRPSTIANDPAGRKAQPIASGVLDYFPDALVAVAEVSKAGNDQHNPGAPLHWDRSKSGDEADAMMRHFMQRGTLDEDGLRHSAKMVWRALALLQKEIEVWING